MIDPNLYSFATARQREILDAIEEHGSNSRAAKALGHNRRYIDRVVKVVERKAAMRGYSPEHGMTRPTAEPYIVKGTSTYYGEDGEPRGQWVKTQLDKSAVAEQLKEVAEILADEVRGKAKPVKAPKATDADLLSVYPFGDPHIGMYAWHAETGNDFDCDIAERDLVAATQKLVAGAPPSEVGVIVNLGDFFHADTLDNTTRRSGHALDVDTRWPRVLRVGVNAMRACIDAALEKHQTVWVENIIGNHDDQSSIALSMILEGYYSNEPRVKISDEVTQYRKYRFGNVLLGMTHGHTSKPEQLGAIMASEWPKEWGETEYRYWLTGHIHTRKVWEVLGCLVESFRTLAARDAWTASQGYKAGRDMQRLTYHKDYGEIGRELVNIAMLRDAA